MSDDKYKDSRDAAQKFGEKMDDAAEDAKEGLDALEHGATEEENEDQDDASGVDVHVDVDVDK